MYKSEFSAIMDRFFQNLFMASHFLLNEPSVFPLSMQGLVQPFRKPSGMVSPIQKVIYVGRFVCPRKQIIHIPHADFLTIVWKGKVIILIICSRHQPYLGIGHKHWGKFFLLLRWKILV